MRQAAPREPPARVTLAAVGDVELGRYIGDRIAREGVDSPYAGVRRLLQGADVAEGNLECALTDAPFAVSSLYRIRARPAFVTGSC